MSGYEREMNEMSFHLCLTKSKYGRKCGCFWMFSRCSRLLNSMWLFFTFYLGAGSVLTSKTHRYLWRFVVIIRTCYNPQIMQLLLVLSEANF